MASSYQTRLGTSPEEGIKAPVVATSTTNITLSGEQTISGVAVPAGKRVLVNGQTDTTENGIYDCSASAWTRATDFNLAEDVVNGVLVLDSTTSAIYRASFTGTWTPDSTSISFTLLSNTSDPVQSVETIAELRLVDVGTLSDGDTIKVDAHTTEGDGGGGWFDYQSGDTDADDNGYTIEPTVGGGAYKRQINTPGICFASWWGSVPGATPAVNLAAINNSASGPLSGGGTLVYGAGVYQFAPGAVATIPDSPVHFHFLGGGYETTIFAPSSYGSADAMLEITASGGVHSVVMQWITVRPIARSTRETFYGIHVGPSNHMRIIDCHALWVDGTAWDFERVYNGEIQVHSFYCGTVSGEVPAWAVRATAATAPAVGAVANDVLIRGTTEQDYWGPLFEHVSNLRFGSELKVHGGPVTERAAVFHNIMNGEIWLDMTLGLVCDSGAGGDVANNMVLVTDDAYRTPTYDPNYFAGYQQTYGFVCRVTTFRNVVPYTDPGSNPLAPLCIALDDPLSNVKVTGLFSEYNATWAIVASPYFGFDCVGIRLLGDGDGLVDITELNWAFDDDLTGSGLGRVLDSRSTKNYTLMSREGPVHLPDTTSLIVTGASATPPGSVVGMSAGGDVTYLSPTIKKLYRRDFDTALGWMEYSRNQPYVLNYPVALSATTFIGCIHPDTLQGTAGAGTPENSTKARIVRLIINAYPVSITWDAVDNWQLAIRHTSTLVRTLNLSGDTFTSASGDGYPDYLGGWTHPGGTGRTFDFTDGLTYTTYGPLQTIGFTLIKNGTPAGGNITSFSITAHIETSIYEEP